MAKITRQEAREMLLSLLFETEFHGGEDPHAVFELARREREIPDVKYIKDGFFGVLSRIEVLDRVIGKYSKGWKADRLSRVSRAIIRLAVYEMLFVEDIPCNVSISQAVELSVKYGEDKAKQFVNGVLSSVYKDLQSMGAEALISSVSSAEDVAEDQTEGENA